MFLRLIDTPNKYRQRSRPCCRCRCCCRHRHRRVVAQYLAAVERPHTAANKESCFTLSTKASLIVEFFLGLKNYENNSA